MRKLRSYRDNRGVALLVAMGALVLIASLSVAYSRYMLLESDETKYDLRSIRANHFARAGFEAAVGTIQRNLLAGEMPSNSLTFEFPVYLGDDEGIVEHGLHVGVADVTVQDESGKVNLNHASLDTLRRLGFDQQTAGTILRSLPLPGQPAHGNQRWLASLGELVERDLVTEDALLAINTKFLTVYTVADHTRPEGFVNINSAPKPVVQAVLGVGPAVADNIIEVRPINDADGLRAAARQEDDANLLANVPAAVGYSSRCFRLTCTGKLSLRQEDGTELTAIERRLEAVVLFPEGESPVVTYWNARPRGQEGDLAAEANEQ